ncbi:MAG: hypothetical protein MSC52_05185, partial [Solobacterium sp.]|nr:hypothetical protein [Solobacterium sp.]
ASNEVVLVMPYIHNFKEQTFLTANCFNKINFQTISSITIDFYIVSFHFLIIYRFVANLLFTT